MSTATAAAAKAARRTQIVRSDRGHILTLEHVPYMDSLEDTMQAVALREAEEGYSILADSAGDAKRLFPRDLRRRSKSPLFFSILLRPKIFPQKAMTVAALTSVAVCRVLRRELDKDAGILWPNRIISKGKLAASFRMKCALHPTDGTYQYVIVSIAIPLADAAERDFLANTVSHVFSGTSDNFRERVAMTLLHEIYTLYEGMDRKHFLPEYRAFLLHKNAPVLLRHPRRGLGTVRDIDDDGRLLVDLPDGTAFPVLSPDDILRIYSKRKTK